MKANMNLWFGDSHILGDPGRYKRLIWRLIYLTVTRPDITFVIGVLSKFVHQPRETHWLAAIKVLSYIRVVQEKGWRTGNMGMYAFLDIQIQVILVTEEIGNLLLSIAPLLEEIW